MNCQHDQPIFTPTPELSHYGKETCAVCGRFIRWMPKPETVERQTRQAAAIVALRSMASLSEWERSFIGTLDEQGPKISPKQAVILDKLISRFLA